MIIGYILETYHGLLICGRFFGAKPSISTELISSAFSSICMFTREVLNQPVEEVLTTTSRIVLAHDGELILSIISQDASTAAEAKRLAKKYVKVFSRKLQGENCTFICDELINKIKDELEEFEREIIEVNERSRHQSYV